MYCTQVPDAPQEIAPASVETTPVIILLRYMPNSSAFAKQPS
jgi:hypothetical protein